MSSVHIIVFFALILGCLSQRSFYAGRDPIGYPKVEVTTARAVNAQPLQRRSGEFLLRSVESRLRSAKIETTTTTTTQRLPLEALGDRELVNRLSQLPTANQPFWLLNWQKLEDNRKGGQTFQQKPNNFVH